MNKTFTQSFLSAFGSMLALAALLLFAEAGMAADAAQAALEGAQEVPPVTTDASGAVDITVADDGTVSGTIELDGIEGTMAHIHTGAPGSNGPPIITLIKDGSDFRVADNTQLTADQMDLYKKGELYVNVHSVAHPTGEIRAQLD